MTHGWIYILTNQSMPGLVKVGLTTTSPSQRQKELSSATGVATPFELFVALEVEDVDKAEKEAHRILEMVFGRTNVSREFFDASPEDAQAVLTGALQKFVVAPKEAGLKEAELLTRKKSFTFACLQFEAEFKKELSGSVRNLTPRLATFFGTYLASCAAIGREPIYAHLLTSSESKHILMQQAIEIAELYTIDPEDHIIQFCRKWS